MVTSLAHEARLGSIWEGSPPRFMRRTCGRVGVLDGVDGFEEVEVVEVVLDAFPQDGSAIMVVITTRAKSRVKTFFIIIPPFFIFGRTLAHAVFFKKGKICKKAVSLPSLQRIAPPHIYVCNGIARNAM